MQYKKDFYRKALAGRYLIGKKKSRRLRYKDLRTSKKFFVKKKLIKKVSLDLNSFVSMNYRNRKWKNKN